MACYGGDGTLNETISGLMQLAHKPLLGYLPAGSTNDFAATLHIPAVPYMAAEIITQGTPMALDVGRHNNRYFSYVASFGAFTRAISPIFWRESRAWTPCVLTTAASLRTRRPSRGISSSAASVTPPPWAAW